MDKLIKYLIAGFTLISALLLNAWASEDEEPIVLTGMDFQEKQVVSGVYGKCHFYKETDLANVVYQRSGDDRIYVEIIGDLNLLKRIKVIVSKGIVAVYEPEFTSDHPVTITGDHPFFKTAFSTGFGFYAKKVTSTAPRHLNNGFLLLEDGQYWRTPIVRVYLPRECFKDEL